MTDFLDRDLFVGDECVCLRRVNIREFILQKGIVIGFEEEKVVLQDPDLDKVVFRVEPRKIVRVPLYGCL
jgi:hypothetical protein